MRIGFVTCVQLGLDCLEEIEHLGGRLEVLITLRDDLARKKSGRIFLDEIVARSGWPLVKVSHINDRDSVAAIRSADLDYLLVIGWSQLVDPSVFGLVRRALLGMHPTLLPLGRGRAPIPWTLIKGLSRSGVTLFELHSKADTGDILAAKAFDVDPNETATTLYEKARKAHVTLIRKAWPKLVAGTLKGRPQDDAQATYWGQRCPEDGEIMPDMSIEEIDRLVRATTHPYPGAFLRLKNGAKLIIWAGCIRPYNKVPNPLPALTRGATCFEPIDTARA